MLDEMGNKRVLRRCDPLDGRLDVVVSTVDGQDSPVPPFNLWRWLSLMEAHISLTLVVGIPSLATHL